MATEAPDELPTQWLSITGQPLDLAPENICEGQCVPISAFEKLNQLGEGTYGVVYRARHRASSQLVALKQVRISAEERQNGMPITALREISILRSLKHPNVINVMDVAVEAMVMDEVYMVMEYAEQDLASMLDELHVKFSMSEVKCLFRQLLEGLEYLHKNGIIHRDVKTQNILLTTHGVLKLADFGMARAYSVRPLTPGVVTIWYRAPELLLGTKHYDPSVDLWSAGLVLAELLQNEPCLTGETPIEQLGLTLKLLGSPSANDLATFSSMGCPDLMRWRQDGLAMGRVDNLERKFLPKTSQATVNFLRGFLRWDPHARCTATEALGIGKSRQAELADRWWNERPRAANRELLPTFPEIRNKADRPSTIKQERNAVEAAAGMSKDDSAYVFDFGGGSTVRRPSKRPKVK